MQLQRGFSTCRAATNHGSVACGGGGVRAVRLASAVKGSGWIGRKVTDSLLCTHTCISGPQASSVASLCVLPVYRAYACAR